MTALEQIDKIITDRGDKLNRDDFISIRILEPEVPLEDSEALAFVWERIALIVNDPLYDGDADPVE
jgi:hypothetical protein